MRTELFSSCIALILAIAAGISRAETNTPPSAALVSAEKADLRLLLHLPQNIYTNGQPVTVFVVLTNAGSTSTLVPPALPGEDLTFAITNSDGLRLPLRKDRHGSHFSGPSSLRLSSRGHFDYPIDLTEYYRLEPGSYRVRAVRDLTERPPWERTVLRSEVVTIRVVQGAAK